jgi:hypothetical protein
MHKSLIAFTAVAALAVSSTMVPNRAEASVAWWWIPVAFVGGAFVGATVAAPHAYATPARANPQPRYYVAPRAQVVPQAAPVRVAAAPGARGCWMEERPGLLGGTRLTEVCG